MKTGCIKRTKLHGRRQMLAFKDSAPHRQLFELEFWGRHFFLGPAIYD